jgi:hypothetical protein
MKKNLLGTLLQTGKSTSTVSEYLLGGKKPLTNGHTIPRNEIKPAKYGK